VGGQDKIRPLWRHYYTGTQALIFVVDSTDHARIDEARVELHRILNEREMKQCLILIFANKQDLPSGNAYFRFFLTLFANPPLRLALSSADITEKLALGRLKDRKWYVHPSVALTGEGLFEGLTWLSNNIKSAPNVTPPTSANSS
jgi:ADP-ribosylation factor protein 6